MRTYVIAAMHGDETFGLKILGALPALNNPNLKLRVGHPGAIAKRKRCLDVDLNRSFLKVDDTKETKIARSIQAEIDLYKPDYILDIHTSTSTVKKVAIAARLSKVVKNLAQATGMESIVVMPPDIARGSLIGCYPDNAISLEFGQHQRSDKLAATIANNICSLEHRLLNGAHNLPVYQVVSVIPKNHPALEGVINLKFNADLGGYPFLAGKDTYPTIGGFLAMKVD